MPLFLLTVLVSIIPSIRADLQVKSRINLKHGNNDAIGNTYTMFTNTHLQCVKNCAELSTSKQKINLRFFDKTNGKCECLAADRETFKRIELDAATLKDVLFSVDGKFKPLSIFELLFSARIFTLEIETFSY